MPAEKIVQFPAAPSTPAKRAKKATRRADGLIAKHFRYTDLYGVSRRKTVYGSTITEAEQKKRAFLAAVDIGLRMEQQGRTVSSWADEWLEVYKKPTVSLRTYTCYKNDLRHLKAAIGDVSLRAVTQSHIQKAYNLRIGASGSALRQYRVTTRALFKAAVANRIIQHNPAEHVKAPDGEDGTHRALTNEEIAIVNEVAAEGHQFALPVMLMLYAGLRRGEMAAIDLRRDVVDGHIHVREGITWPVNQPVRGDTKTDAGVRAIPIMPPLEPYLKGEMRRLTESAIRRGMSSFNYACAVKLNGCSRRWKPKNHIWIPFEIRTHDLRHTFATMLYDAGVDVKTAQTWLGHADPAITMKIYTHLSKERESAARESAINYFSGGKNGGKPFTTVYRIRRRKRKS